MRVLKKDFDLYSSILSGQCFRMIEEDDNSFTTILKDRVINIKEDNEYLIITSSNEENLEEIITNYFDLNTDYNSLIDKLSNKDKYMKQISKYCIGYKIFNQDKFEMLISYIISQNNSVKRISNSINKICIKCGKKITFNNKEYYLFPTFDELKTLTKESLRETGIGFRDSYIINALNHLENNPNFLNELDNKNTEECLKELTSIKGIGMKVASCILLFGYHRFDVYPIDTWVIKNIENNYKNVTPNQKKITEFTKNKFGNLSGLAIQYMFNYERNKK